MLSRQSVAVGVATGGEGGIMGSLMDDDTIMVEINRELELFIPMYLENVKADCLVVEALLEREDMEEIESLGHRLKGSGGSCGFSVISEAGETLELAAAARDREAVVRACRALRQHLEQVRVVYV